VLRGHAMSALMKKNHRSEENVELQQICGALVEIVEE